METEKFYKLKIADLEQRVLQLETELKAMRVVPAKTYYTVKEYADIMSVSMQTVYNQLYSGEICGVKVGKGWRIPAKQLTL